MLIDALTLPADTLIEKDICIIGAGAAGITLARELAHQPFQVCLLESGGLDFEADTQSLYKGENLGVSYFPIKESRARYLGGSTNLWGGWSRPLDDIDFSDRPWMPHSGWCFTKADLVPYYKRAQQACKLGPFKYDLASWQEALSQVQHQELPVLPDDLETYIWQIIPSPYLRFGEVYRAEIEQARNITTYLHANAVEIEANETAQTVKRLRVASLDGKQFWIAAKVFILAVGGIENPRLLLASNKVQNTGLGNQYNLVGRYFMEHPYLMAGKAMLSNAASFFTRINFRVDDIYMATGVGLSEAVQEREQVLNFSLRFLPIEEEWVEAFRRLKKLRNPRQGHDAFPTITEGFNGREASAIADMGKVITHLDHLAAKAYQKLFKSCTTEKSHFCDIHLIGEQAPNPDSRVLLSRERDRLGINCVQLDWRLSPIDKYTMQRSSQLIAAEFERAGLGKLQVDFTTTDETWRSLKGSYHHIGTTRMHHNPKHGVVNEHCQVHGISNLYIAGSSVFPTSGLSNPTLTIVALAIRLADHIKAQMREPDRITIGLEATPALISQ